MSEHTHEDEHRAEVVAAAIAWRDAKDHGADGRLIDAVDAMREKPKSLDPASVHVRVTE